MTDQEKPLTMEQRLSNTIQLAQNLESVNKEAKAICDGLISRCAQLACERDNASRTLDAAKTAMVGLSQQIVDLRKQVADLEAQLKTAQIPAAAPAVAIAVDHT